MILFQKMKISCDVMRDDELIQDVEDADMAEFPAAVKEAVSEAKVMII